MLKRLKRKEGKGRTEHNHLKLKKSTFIMKSWKKDDRNERLYGKRGRKGGRKEGKA
jgi:hypothetical protein